MLTDIDTTGIVCAANNLRVAARAATRIYDHALAPMELTTTQYAILVNVDRKGTVPSMQLAGTLSLERTTLYRALAVLERRDLISHQAGRGREQILSLTPAGQSLLVQAKQAWQKVQDNFTSAFGPDWPLFLAMTDRARRIAEEIA